MKFNTKFFFISFAYCLFLLPVFSQTSIRIPIHIGETLGSPPQGIDTVWFGYTMGASYGIDTGLGEHQLPPPPPAGSFDVRMTNIPGHENQNPPVGFGQGLKLDVRSFRSGVDTFRVQWQTGSGTYPMTISWPAGLDVYADSIRIEDEGNGIFVSANMTTSTSLSITNDIVTALIIYFYPKPLGVKQVSETVPLKFKLSQNYPNPFNPSTTIQFALPSSEFTSLKVYNLLGEEVKTLVHEFKQAGTYSVTLNASELPSGVYLVKLKAGSLSDEKKIVLMK